MQQDNCKVKILQIQDWKKIDFCGIIYIETAVILTKVTAVLHLLLRQRDATIQPVLDSPRRQSNNSLGVDENNCPVIFEYKRSSNENAINLIYRDGDGNGSKSFSSGR